MPPRKRAGDLTGIETQRLQKEFQEQQKEAAKRIAIMAEVKEEEDREPIDYSEGPISAVPQDDLDFEEEIKVESPTRTIIPNQTLEQVTFGSGNHYDFEEGRKYVVPVELARHLSSKGLLWESNGYR